MNASSPCTACAYSYMEPDDDNLVCGYKDASTFGVYVKYTIAPKGHCGPTKLKFEQHPLRNVDGTLKKVGS